MSALQSFSALEASVQAAAIAAVTEPTFPADGQAQLSSTLGTETRAVSAGVWGTFLAFNGRAPQAGDWFVLHTDGSVSIEVAGTFSKYFA